MEKHRSIQFDIGDRTKSNHFLESITFVNNVGEIWSRTALYIQFRRGAQEELELISKNGKRDQLYVTMHVVNPNFLPFYEFEHETVKTCLQKAHLSVLPDDGKAPFSTDYTRCAAFDRYGIDVDWKPEDFIPTPPPDTANPKEIPDGVKCMGNPFAVPRIFDGVQVESLNLQRLSDSILL